MTLVELALSVALGIIVSFLSLTIANNQAHLTKSLASYQSFINTEANLRDSLTRTIGTANTATIYDNAANARNGTQTGISSSGSAIFLTFVGGRGATGSGSSWATIELNGKQLIYHNSNGNDWVLIDSLTNTVTPFASTNGVYITNISVNENSIPITITIFTNLQ